MKQIQFFLSLFCRIMLCSSTLIHTKIIKMNKTKKKMTRRLFHYSVCMQIETHSFKIHYRSMLQAPYIAYKHYKLVIYNEYKPIEQTQPHTTHMHKGTNENNNNNNNGFAEDTLLHPILCHVCTAHVSIQCFLFFL